MVSACIHTPLGSAWLEGDESGVRMIRLQDGHSPTEVPTVLKPAASQLLEYFEGNRTTFDFAINPQGTPFQKKVWSALLEIPFGKTCTYMDLAKKLGDPKAIRAVGTANGKNPIAIVVPCHRVVGSGGGLVGYAGGLPRKQWLLNHESPHPQQSLF